jgi:hypothetical protein
MNPDAVRLAFCAAVLAAVDALLPQVPDAGAFSANFTEKVRVLAAGLRATDALGTATGAVKLSGTGNVVYNNVARAQGTDTATRCPFGYVFQ